MNATVRGVWTGSVGDEIDSQPFLKNDLTASGWSPYFNQVQLFRNQLEEPVMIANLPRPIKMRDDIDLIITFRVDH